MTARSRFVRPDTATLTISNGDTLTVKRRLNAGELRAMYARLYLAGADGVLKTNPLAIGVATIEAYLLDWSFRDDDDRPVVIRDVPVEDLRAKLDALDSDSFREIREAIDAHIERMETERTAEKNGQAGETTLSAISPSLSGVAGSMSGLPS